MIDQVMRDGRDPGVFLKDISYHFRSLLLAKTSPEALQDILDLTQEDADELKSQAEGFTVSRLMNIMDLYMNAETEMRFSNSPRIALENVSLKCCVRSSETDTRALADRIEELERKISVLEGKIASGAVSVQTMPTGPAASAVSAPAPVKKTAVKPAAPKKTVDSAGLGAAWNELIARFRKEEPAVWSMLTQGNMTMDDERTIRWSPLKPEGAEFFINTLNKEEKKKKIIDALHEITGTEIMFHASAAQQAAKETDKSDEAYIGKLYETFGQEPVDVVE